MGNRTRAQEMWTRCRMLCSFTSMRTLDQCAVNCLPSTPATCEMQHPPRHCPTSSYRTIPWILSPLIARRDSPAVEPFTRLKELFYPPQGTSKQIFFVGAIGSDQRGRAVVQLSPHKRVVDPVSKA